MPDADAPPPAADPAPPPGTDFFGAEPWQYDFYRAARLLECLARPGAPDGHWPRLGTSLRPQDDPVRFGQTPSLAFAPATLSGYEPAAGARPARLFSCFLGLFGPNGALPLHLTEHALERRHPRAEPLPRFLDVFHHRMIALFYRAWANSQKAVDFDRPAESRFAGYIGSFFGLGMRSLHDRDAAPDRTKLYFSGRLAPQPRNPEGLEAIVSEDLGVPVRLLTFVGQWLRLPAESRCKLGASPESGTLGRTAIVGARFWDGQLKFRLRLGPLSLADYLRLLPTGTAWRRLLAWVRNYTGHELDWEAQLVLRAAEVPRLRLGRAGMLGWSAWLKTGDPKTLARRAGGWNDRLGLESLPFPRDADDLVLSGAAG